MFALLQLYKWNLETQDNAANYIISTNCSQQGFLTRNSSFPQPSICIDALIWYWCQASTIVSLMITVSLYCNLSRTSPMTSLYCLGKVLMFQNQIQKRLYRSYTEMNLTETSQHIHRLVRNKTLFFFFLQPTSWSNHSVQKLLLLKLKLDMIH